MHLLHCGLSFRFRLSVVQRIRHEVYDHDSAFQLNETWLFVGLLIASAGVVDHSGIKIPFFAFFAHDSGKRVKEAPMNMLIAMGIAAVFCLALGFEFFYKHLYALLPFEVREGINPDGTSQEWHNYSAAHVLTYLQLLLFAALAFVVLMKTSFIRPSSPRSIWTRILSIADCFREC